MRNVVLAVGLLAMTACGKSKCEKYADMEVKCGGYPAKEADITYKLSAATCSQASSASEPTLKRMGERTQREADCAEKYTDCPGYKSCVDAVK